MSVLSSISENANVAVVGASGGIGSEFVRQLSSDPRVAQVHAMSRSAREFASDNVLSHVLDFDDEETIRAAAIAATSSAPFDVVIVASGLLHDGDTQPEKSMAQIEAFAMLDVMRINTVGPALVAKHFLPLMRRRAKTVFAALSARVGSISDNRLGGWASYRASKAALNMLLKTASIEHARRFPQSVIVGLHPGTVDTELSRPFQRRVPEKQLFTPAYSVSQLLQVIDQRVADESGRCFAWDGQVIEY
jgi:NAD(P)-dependent dehydrogenase (short-subunit alcohol dehydrogenase family)